MTVPSAPDPPPARSDRASHIREIVIAILVLVAWLMLGRPSRAPATPTKWEQEEQVRAQIDATNTLQWARVQLVEHLGPPPADAPTPAEVLAEAARRYRQCRSFEDRGQHWGKLGGRVSEMRFELAFVRPDRFRLVCREVAMIGAPEWQTTVVWQQGADVRLRTPYDPGIERPATLGLALSLPFWDGFTGGIPRLLAAGEGGTGLLHHIDRPRHDCMARINDRPCYCIRGTWGGRSDPYALWLDAETFVVRRTEQSSVLPDGTSTAGITLYHPRMDVEIAPARLEFEASKQAPGDARTGGRNAGG